MIEIESESDELEVCEPGGEGGGDGGSEDGGAPERENGEEVYYGNKRDESVNTFGNL